jgi:type III restriction enzyme
MFEEEYRRLADHPNYATLFQGVDLTADASEVHAGYFARDKKGDWVETGADVEGNAANREIAERAYHLIMKDKEPLLVRY